MKKFIIFILFTFISILSANTFFVKTAADGGDNGNSGLSWENAKAMIEPAVESSAVDDTILVKYGTYLFTTTSNEIEITSNRKIISDDGDGTGWNDAEPDSSLCIIDADEHCRIFSINGNSVTNETRIKGFKITNGKDIMSGGGIHINNADPIIENCWITENMIWAIASINGNGGGIYCNNSGAIIKKNIISKNIGSTEDSEAGNGGGISCENSDVTISYNVFYENANDISSHSGKGSGIYLYGGSPEIKNNIFMNHDIANSDKRAIYSEQTGFNVSYNCFYNNSVANYNTTSTNSVEADPKFTDAENGDFSITYESPCIDAGETLYTYNETENHHKGWKTDIGVYEYTGNRIKIEVTEIGELLFGGNVRAKINVTNLNTLTAIDITVHPAETHSELQDGVQRWFDITPTGEVAEFGITLSYKDTELNDNDEDYLNLFRWDGSALDAPKPADVLDSTQNLLSVNNETAFSQWMIKYNLPDVDEFSGNCLEFDGIDDYVDLNEPDNLQLENFTVSCWFKRIGEGVSVSTGAGGVSAEPLVTKGRAESDGSNVDMNYFLGIRESDKVLSADFEEMNSGNNHPVSGVTAIEDNIWYHAAATYDGSIWQLYLNGNLEAESTEDAIPRYDSIQDNAIGSALNSAGTPLGYFKGCIDEVSIWDTALDSLQIREQIHLNLSGLEAGLVSYWQFNNGSELVLSDKINNNQGTLTNMDNSDWVDSTIPFGSGVTDTQTETSGTVDFTDTGLSMYFNSQIGAEITVTRIDTIPNVNPTEPDEVFDAQYWVVNRFGTGNFEADITFALNEDLTSEDEAVPVQIKLYTRSITADDSWIYLCNANSVNAANDKVTFNGITTFSQFIIARQIPQVDAFSGNCLVFDGIDDYVNCGNNNSLNFEDEITFEAWIKADSLAENSRPAVKGDFQLLFWDKEYEGSSGKGYQIKLPGTSNPNYIEFNHNFEHNEWYQVSWTYSSSASSLKMYVNGSLNKELTLSGSITINSDDLMISDISTGNRFLGCIDEIRLWNTVRTEQQIHENMYLPLSGLETGLVSYWQFNEESGTVLEDKISVNNGTLNNMEDNDWIDSTIPFGEGVSNSQTETDGSVDFTNTGLSMFFNSQNGAEITVTRIDTTAKINPTDPETVFDSQFWVVNRYGAGTFDTDLTFTISEDLTAEYESNPSIIKLYTRYSNADTNWVFLTDASSVNAANNEATFDGITEFSQFIVCRNLVAKISVNVDSLFFDNVLIEESKTDTLWIFNTGNDTLNVSSIISDEVQFTADIATCQVIPCDSCRILVTLSPMEENTITGILTITSNDNNEPTIEIYLEGDGVIPQLTLLKPTDFEFVNNNFNSIYENTRLTPTFTDLDGDGLLDMILGEIDGRLYHFKQNEENSTEFTLITSSFNSIWVIHNSTPTFTDLDGDGLLDLIVGSQTGYLYHYEQNTENSTEFTMVTNSFNSIDVGSYSAPSFTDLDGDGLLDLIVGEYNGYLYHYKQNEENSTEFTLITNFFNSIDLSNYSNPTFTDLNSDGLLDLIIGENNGNLNHYEQNEENSTEFTLVTNSLSSIDVGSTSTPTFTDLDGDDLLDLIIGEYSFNLNHYEQEQIQSLEFGYVILDNTLQKDYLIKATGLVDNLIISCPDRFSASLSSQREFVQNLTISPVNGRISEPIYIQFEPESEMEYSGNISHSSFGMETQYIAVSGTGATIDCFPGTALEFDGTDDYVDLGEPENLKLENFTLTCWFKRSGDGSISSTGTGGMEAEPLVTKGRGEADGNNRDMNYFLGIDPATGYLAADFEEMDSGDNHPVFGTTTIENNLWYHATATYDGSIWRLYLNGDLEAESTENATPRWDSIQDNAIGTALTSTGIPSGYFNGFIDEVSIWNTALDSLQIREQIHLNLSGIETGLVGYWQFNDASGIEAIDKISANDGTLTNMDTLNCWIDSTIPFGEGFCDTEILTTTGFYDFNDADFRITLNSEAADDVVVVSKINLSPNIIPEDIEEVLDDQYWIMHHYGSSVLDLLDIVFKNVQGITEADVSEPSRIKLYRRESNADSVWVAYDTCINVQINGNLNEVIFENITEYGQFIIARSAPQYLNIPQNISIEIIGTNVQISWDAVTGANSYKIFSADNPYGTFTENESGIFTDESWSALFPNGKMFYYVIASSESVRDNISRLSEHSKVISK